MSVRVPTTDEVDTGFTTFAWELEKSSPGAYGEESGYESYHTVCEGFRAWLAEVERASAEKALTDAARQMPFPADPYGGFDHESLRAAFVQSTNWLRDRAEAYRQERKEQ